MTYAYNLTAIRSDETLIITRINYDRVNYIQYNDLKMGLVKTGNDTNKYLFNIQSTTRLPEIARISLNLIKENIGKTARSIITNFNENIKIIETLNNETNILKLSVDNYPNVYLLEHTDTGIIECIIVLDGFNYNGAISEPLVEDNGTGNNSKNIKKNSDDICFEDSCNDELQEKAYSLLGFTTDSGWAVLEGTAGTIFVSVAIGIAVGTITVTCAPVVFAACLIGGAFLMLDSHGILSGEATTEDWISLGVDVAMLGISPVM